jgi:hypothetical protein
MKNVIRAIFWGMLIFFTAIFIFATGWAALVAVALVLSNFTDGSEFFGCPANQLPIAYRVIFSLWGSLGWLGLFYVIGRVPTKRRY